MNRQLLIESIMQKISHLPDVKIKEVDDYADFLLGKIDDQILQEGIQNLVADAGTFDFLKDEEDLYTVEDLKTRFSFGRNIKPQSLNAFS